MSTALRSVLLALASAACLAACGGGAYTGAGVKSLPPAQVAVLEHDNPAHSAFVISHIDGQRRGIGIFHEYRLAPGPHAIRLTGGVPVGESNGPIADRSLISRQPLEAVFVAQAGQRYRIDVDFDIPNKTWGAFVIDKSTGKVVSTTRTVAD